MGITLIQVVVNTLDNGLIIKRRVMESKNGCLLNNYIYIYINIYIYIYIGQAEGNMRVSG